MAQIMHQDIRNDHFIIRHSPTSDVIQIFRFYLLQNGSVEYVHHGKDGKQMHTLIKAPEIYTTEWEPWVEFSGRDYDLMEDLMDALIEFGIQPKKHVLTSEEKSAIQDHLSDMRKIVAAKLGVNL